jgi:Family of unknown function (DUF6515)
MFKHTTNTGHSLRRSRAFRLATAGAAALIVLAAGEVSADRRASGGSVRQSNKTSTNAGANRNNNYDRDTNANRNTNVNRDTNANRNTNVNQNVNVNRNTNVNVNRNVNANTGYYGRPGGVAVGEEGAVAVGRHGAVAATEEGFVGVGRHGAVVGGERYESYEGWKVAAGVATGIAVGTMLARPPTASVTVVSSGTNYMYADGAFFEQVYYGGEVSYRVVAAPAGAIITTLPGGCTTTVMGGVSVQQCGSTYYKRVSNGYQVVVF